MGSRKFQGAGISRKHMWGVEVGQMKQVFSVSFRPYVENKVENIILLYKIIVPLYF